MILDFEKAVEEKEADLPHIVSELICIKCFYRYISVRPTVCLLKTIECPECGAIGTTINTGENLEATYELT